MWISARRASKDFPTIIRCSSAGGDIPALVEALKESTNRRATLSRDMAELNRAQDLDENDYDELEAELRAHFRRSWETLRAARSHSPARSSPNSSMASASPSYPPDQVMNSRESPQRGSCSSGVQKDWCPQGDLNRSYSLERASATRRHHEIA